MTPPSLTNGLCAACRVYTGVCPDCGTFWWIANGKRKGLLPVDPKDYRAPGETGWQSWANPAVEALPNYVEGAP